MGVHCFPAFVARQVGEETSYTSRRTGKKYVLTELPEGSLLVTAPQDVLSFGIITRERGQAIRLIEFMDQKLN